MSFRCLGDAVDPEPYLLNRHSHKPQDRIAHLKRLMREKNLKYNKLQSATDKLRRKNEQLKNENLKLLETNSSLISAQLETNESLQSLAEQTRTKIKELHNENQHVQECYNKLKHTNNSKETRITDLGNEVKHLTDIVSRKEETIKALLPYREQCKLLIVQLDEMNKIYKQNEVLYKKQISVLKNDSSSKLQRINSSKSQISLLQNDLANMKQDFMNVMDSKSTENELPTMQEILWIFNDIRDSIYTQTSNVLKKFIQTKLNNDNKSYIKQVCHEIMFGILIQSYIVTDTYKQQMFDNVKGIMNVCSSKSSDFLQKMLMNYCRVNYSNMEVFEKVKMDIINALKESSKDYYHREIALNIFDLNRDSKEMIEILKYIKKCIGVCWVMVLSDIKFYPCIWRARHLNGNSNQFSQDIHERVLGSNTECKHILYYVWPLITNNDNIVGNQKIEVVTRDSFYKDNN